MILRGIALSWLAGAALAALGVPARGMPALALLTGAILGLWHAQRRGRIHRLACTVALAGVALAGTLTQARDAVRPASADVARFVDAGPARVRGIVDADRDERECSLELLVHVQSVEDDSGWHDANGTVVAVLPLSLPYDYGDALELRGKLTAPPKSPGFNCRGYPVGPGRLPAIIYPTTRLLGHNQGDPFQAKLVRLRERLADGITAVLPEPEASLGAGITLGTKRVIEPTLNEALINTGTMQIVVASGFNITIVSAFVISGLAWLIGRRWAALLSLPAIGLYAIFVGLYPSVLRAAVMGVIYIWATLAGRPHSGMRALILATAIMTLPGPPVLSGILGGPQVLHDISFQLSLSSTAGLFLIAPPLIAGVRWLLTGSVENDGRLAALGGLADSTGTTLAAMIASLPVILVNFHTLSPSSLPANDILFPLVPAIMATSAATSIAGALWHPAALLFAPLAYILLHIMVLVVRFCAGLPDAILEKVGFDLPSALGYYALLSVGAVMLRSDMRSRVRAWLRQTPDNDRSDPDSQWAVPIDVSAEQPPDSGLLPALPAAVHAPASAYVAELLQTRSGGRRAMGPRFVLAALAPVAIGAALFAFVVLRSPGADVRVTFLDVGQGSAVLVESSGTRVLINGGPPGEATVRALDRRLAPWDRSLNLVVASDGADGHVGGLPAVLQRYRVDAVVDGTPRTAARSPTGPAVRNWQRAILGSSTRLLPRQPVTTVVLRGARLIIQMPPPSSGSAPPAPATTTLYAGSTVMLVSGDSAGNTAADIRVLPSGWGKTLERSPAIGLLESSSALQSSLPGARPSALRHTLIYRTTENGDVVISLGKHDARIEPSRGPKLGMGTGGPS